MMKRSCRKKPRPAKKIQPTGGKAIRAGGKVTSAGEKISVPAGKGTGAGKKILVPGDLVTRAGGQETPKKRQRTLFLRQEAEK
ncbi:MAG: hypothetical protein ACQEQ0_02895 [Bacteroidota bacterium]